METLKRACFEVGFFYLDGHGIPKEEFQRVFEQSKQLFDLPTDEKMKLSDPSMGRGYSGFQEEKADGSSRQKEGDTKEGYRIDVEIPATHPKYDPSKFRGPNQWPDGKSLPEFD